MNYTWDDIKTKAQRDALTKACTEELERLRKSPKLKGMLEESLEICNGGSSLIVYRNGTVFWHLSYRSDYGFDLDWRDENLTYRGKLIYKKAYEAFVDCDILPRDIKKARREIER